MFDGMVIEPPFARELIIGLGVLLALLTLVNYARTRRDVGGFKRGFLALLRLSVVAGLTIVLLRPMAPDKQAVVDANAVFSILVDTSQSMNTCDVDGKARLQSAVKALKEGEGDFLSRLHELCEVQYFTFAEDLTATTFEQLTRQEKAEGPKTGIAATLTNAASIAPSQKKLGILLISDGRENEGGEVLSAANYLKSMNVPVWTTTVGTKQETTDVFVSARVNQNFLFAKQEAELKIEINHSGYEDWYAKVDVLREGESIGAHQVKLDRACERLSVPIREDLRGTYRYTVKVEPLRGEADLVNNERTVFVRVTDERSKILLVEAQPYWDTKFLLRALQADPNFEVTSIFCLSSKKVVAITQRPAGQNTETGNNSPGPVRIPRTKEELDQYDCVILGKGVEAVFTADELALFKNYLQERGGNIIFARGKAAGAKATAEFREFLSEVEPVEWDAGSLARARFELTPAGTVSPVFNFDQARSAGAIIREMPELISVARVKDAKTLAVVLAKGKSPDAVEEMATVSYHRYGKGKVLSLGATGLWRWAFMPEKLQEYDEVYARFWGQLIRWLVFGSDFMPGQEISFRTDRMTYDLEEEVSFVVQTRYLDTEQYAPEIELTTPGHETVRMAPARSEDAPEFYATTFAPKEEGEYTAVLRNNVGEPKEDTLRFAVYADSVETRIVAADQELMGQIADITSGAELSIGGWGDLPELVRAFERATREEMKPKDIWDRASVFFLLVGLLAVEWLARRRLGLV